jgi:hypothetical protein
VSDVHTITAAGYTMTFSMPAFNWLTPGQILEVPGLPDGILVKLSERDNNFWISTGLDPQNVEYSKYYCTYPNRFNLDTVDPFWGVVGTSSSGGMATGARFLVDSDSVNNYSGGGIKTTNINVVYGGTGYAVNQVLPVYPLAGYQGYGGSLRVTELVTNSTTIKTVVRQDAGYNYTNSIISTAASSYAAGVNVPVQTAVEFAAYNVAAVKYSATAHVTEVR